MEQDLATVVKETLTDGSFVYNVHIFAGLERVAIIECESAAGAAEISNAILLHATNIEQPA